jgi:hypothetical protein
MGTDDASSAEMRRSFTDPDADPLALDEETVERLLAGDLSPAEAPTGYAEVAALLAATVAEPTPEELAGQSAALAELRAVTRTRRAASRRRAARPPGRRRVGLAAVALVGALATGGAAAAATGRLPDPVRDAARSILGTVGGAEPASPTQAGPRPAPVEPGATSGAREPRPTAAAGHGPGSTVAGQAPGLDNDGLCRAFNAGKGAGQGRQMEAAAFAALARLAGGAERIPAYCEGVERGRATPKDKESKAQEPPPGGQGQGPGQGQGQGGPPTSTGDQGRGASSSRPPGP